MAVRMSVEQPLWRALLAYRLLTAGYAVALYVHAYGALRHPLPAGVYIAVLAGWTLATVGRVANAERCTRAFLAVDLAIAVTGILLTRYVDTGARIESGSFTLPSIWTAGSVLAFAIKGGWRWAAVASSLVAAADLVERGSPGRDTVHNVILIWVASIAIGYVVEVARASERTLARALQIEAATRERERLARDIHDGVLQVLAMVQRRGNQAGGEAAELGRLAGEQEAALRCLISGAPPAPRGSGDGGSGDGPDGRADGPHDLRTLLAPHASSRVTLSAPGTPVLLDPHAAAELAAAVGAALDNVRRHAGEQAHAWILVEDEPDAVLVTVRDDGPGIADGRLAAAADEGRLGVAQSIRGRLRDLGGGAELLSVPGQGTEVELRLPRRPADRAPAGTGESGAALTDADGRGRR
ncbi:MacS family sensor histidine kinase [Streptomyces sp. NPDC020917]|uniref:MacS family sensor histidine kinase n=1 Tax=Streptomyces sp. NPDC020917 TaxID=3365102 RepID=UPI0037945E4B